MLLADYKRFKEMNVNEFAEHFEVCRPTMEGYLKSGVTLLCKAEAISKKTEGLVTVEDLIFQRSPKIDMMKALKFYLENAPEASQDEYTKKFKEKERVFYGQMPC